MPEPALISVVIPVHNGERYLTETIESALAQTHRRIEVLVADHGSTDSSGEIARAFGSPVRWIDGERNEGEGAGVPRNHAIAYASGSYLAPLDADDLWHPRKLEIQIGLLEREDAEIAFCHARQFLSPDLSAEEAARLEDPPEPAPARQAGTMLIGREDFERVGPFGTAQMGEFLEWLLRARERGLRETVAEEILYERRLHPGGHSISGRPQARQYAEILKRSLDRRRARGETPESPEAGE